ncbi:alpha/beta fold hydrolase [Kitasatospora sp. NPDC052896]|uniref:alpha/beta fold hydrolase n=1 Tax=Kitasatospora sp. NPDC052896 TaxID=3364061 RepID=UPI0037C7325B
MDLATPAAGRITTATVRTGSLRTGGAALNWRADQVTTNVVLVHGSFDDHTSWDRIVPLLPHDITAIRYDRRGHSRSSAPAGRSGLHDHAGDLVSVITELAGGAAHLVGHSYGALVALMTAARHPELVSSVLVHEPPAFPLLADDPQGEPLRAEARAHVTTVAAHIEAGRQDEAVALFAEKVAFGPRWRELFPQPQRAVLAANAHTYLDQFHDPDHYALDLEALATDRVPITVTVGTDGPAAVRRCTQLLADRLPAATVETLTGAGHAPHLSHPDEFAAALARHLGRVRRS